MKNEERISMSQTRVHQDSKTWFQMKTKSTNQNWRNKGEELKPETKTKIRKVKDEWPEPLGITM